CLDHPVPPFRRQVLRSRANDRNTIGNGDWVARVLVDEAQLILRISVEQIRVVLVISARVIEKAEIAPCGMLDGGRSLLKFGAISPRTNDEIGRHVDLEMLTSVESPQTSTPRGLPRAAWLIMGESGDCKWFVAKAKQICT